MVFGEIVEPSTRALIIDEEEEFVDYPVDHSFRLQWDGIETIPNVINSLVFVESAPLLKLLKTNKTLFNRNYASIKDAGVSVYALDNNDYLVVSNVPENYTHAEIIENLSEWIERAQNVYCITSKPQQLFINFGVTANSETFIRSLTHKNANDFNWSKLESPNLATGIAAAVLTFSIVKNKPCGLFIAYIGSAPLDSITAQPIVDLLGKLNVCKKGDFKLDVDVVPSNNLYM